jgi:hypothetical protein
MPAASSKPPDGRIAADVDPVVWSLASRPGSDVRVRHRYTLPDGLIWRMDVLPEADQGP